MKKARVFCFLFYEEADALKYWKEYNDLNDDCDNDKIDFIKEIYNKRINTRDHIVLDKIMKDKLAFWFGDNINECIISLEEMNVFLNDFLRLCIALQFRQID